MDVSYLSLKNKVALVTGGSRGIGKAIALAFADAGADIVVSSRKLPALEEVAGEITAMGRRALPVAANGRHPEDLRQLIETVKEEFGRLDILVNNAATNPVMAPMIEIEETAFDVIMNTNLKGYFLLAQMAANLMIEQGKGGSILNISSLNGFTPDKGLGVYSISKAAINMLTRALALELGEYDIRVNGLAPGVIKTRFSQARWDNEEFSAQDMARTPLQRFAEPEEVARMALSMVSETASYITGQILLIDGGRSI
ncbi:MAG: SDR family oxidoreductase [SAR324 cluster bacterium]|nr:SDR family oxidoreductase [SAR324 cluster bacterium]